MISGTLIPAKKTPSVASSTNPSQLCSHPSLWKSRQLRNQHQAGRSFSPILPVIRSPLKISSLKDQLAHPAAGRGHRATGHFKTPEKNRFFLALTFFYCFAGELAAIKLSLFKHKSSFLLFPRSNGMALLLL